MKNLFRFFKRERTLLGVYERFLADYRAKHEAGLKSKKSLEKYTMVYRHLSDFIDWHYHQRDVRLGRLDTSFIENFEVFLRSQRGLSGNTVWLYVAPLRTMTRIACQHGWLAYDPFAHYTVRRQPTQTKCLTRDEIELLIRTPLPTERLTLYRDLFVFCIFTGLSYIDLCNLAERHLTLTGDGRIWISIARQKTGVLSEFYLLDLPAAILHKYRGIRPDGIIFPVPPYTSCLKGIRAVARACGISRRLTWHMARHTMATEVCLNNGMSIESVSSVLGHRNIRTTQTYAKVTRHRLDHDFQQLSSCLPYAIYK